MEDIYDLIALNAELDALTGGVVSFESNHFDGEIEGVRSWAALHFNTDQHRDQLNFMVLANGLRVASQAEAPAAKETRYARWYEWHELFTAENIEYLASENKRYDHSHVEVVMALLRPLIYGQS